MKTCLVLGATGFIGGQIAREAVARGWQVRALRRISGSRRYAGAQATFTDDRGAYRFGGLLPGDYRVVASPAAVSARANIFADAARTAAGKAQAEHAEHAGHDEHASHADHTGHEQVFRRRFWVSLALSVPVLLYSPMIQELLGFRLPAFAGSEWIPFAFSLLIFAYGGVPFLRLALPEIRKARGLILDVRDNAKTPAEVEKGLDRLAWDELRAALFES